MISRPSPALLCCDLQSMSMCLLLGANLFNFQCKLVTVVLSGLAKCIIPISTRHVNVCPGSSRMRTASPSPMLASLEPAVEKLNNHSLDSSELKICSGGFCSLCHSSNLKILPSLLFILFEEKSLTSHLPESENSLGSLKSPHCETCLVNNVIVISWGKGGKKEGGGLFKEVEGVWWKGRWLTH